MRQCPLWRLRGDVHRGKRDDLGIDHQGFRLGPHLQRVAQAQDIAGGNGLWTDRVIAAFTRFDRVLEISAGARTQMNHGLETVWTR